jgi:hypothetical protein
MKLNESFKHRIVTDNPQNIRESIEKCMTFLESLALDPSADNKFGHIQNKLQKIDNTNPLPTIYRDKKNVLFDEIIPLLQNIAPEDCYFGSHPRDKKLVGFWEKSLLS